MIDQRCLLRCERFDVYRVKHVAESGEETVRGIVRHPGAVTVLPMVERDRVCLIRNYRLSVDRTLWELPAGTLEPGEDPDEAARRELAEETGYRAGRWERMHRFYLSPGILDERMHLYRAEDLTEGPAAREPGERIENRVVSWREAMAMVRDGAIEDAKTIVALLLHEIERGA